MPRELERRVLKAARSFPAVVLTGPRRTVETTPLQHHFHNADHVLLETPDITHRPRPDPQDSWPRRGRHEP